MLLPIPDEFRLRDANVTVSFERVVAHASRHISGTQARRTVDDPKDDVIVFAFCFRVSPLAGLGDVTSGFLQAPASGVPRYRIEVTEDLVGGVWAIGLSRNTLLKQPILREVMVVF